mmetsp:Transcript_36357/g.74117  ORF Transcript_36357/g.74117 Transcript_36357/m.74117 type:complete len:864 (-) Transcript_36357:1037-3628(-)
MDSKKTAKGGARDLESENSTTSEEIANDDLIAQILARLDNQAFDAALHRDAKSMNNNFLLPPHFPWRDKLCLPQKIAKTIPRDIDDLHVVTHCDDELYAPFGDFKGPLGFGRYDNGQTRGNYGVHQDAQDVAPSLMPMKPDGGSAGTKPRFEPTAAARRSADPGVIELMVQALPSSIEDTGRTFSPDRWRSRLLADPDHSETFSRLPFSWKSVKGNALLDDVRESQSQMTNQNMAAGMSADDVEFLNLREAQLIAQERRNIALSCTQKWKISVKAGGVSSRSTLFPISKVMESNSDDLPENARKVLRPMLCTASLPQSILTGETVSTERAVEMDNDGLAYSLGSYDCRVVEKLSNPKKDFSRSKKVEVGRNRLVWSNIIQADDPFFPTTRSKVSYNSLVTGQKLDEKKNKRQTEIKVGVRISGKLLIEEALEDQPVANVNSRKRKHSTRQVENEAPTLKRPLVPESRTDEEIDLAFNTLHAHVLAQKPARGDATKSATNDSDVVYLDTGDSALPSFVEKRDIISSLMKLDQKKATEEKKRRGSSSQSVPIRPRFACVPLEDGLLRTVCLQAGNMTSVAAHQSIQDAMTSESRQVCSVCWSDDGDGEERVLDCVDCGLLAHSNCCYDKGELLANGSTNGNSTSHWRCAVCKHFAGMKSKRRRALKMPSRFDDCETNESLHHTSNGDDSKDQGDIPCPSCSLCPHRGGAMSQIHDDSDKWAHEVCRVWSGPKDEILKRSPLSTVCALCGTGGAGLTRCAARGCFVSFHPMCALLTSKMETSQDNHAGKKRRKSRHNNELDEEDTKLCNEYTLQLVQLSRPGATDGNNTKGEDTACNVVPIAFCGLHNPRRDASYFGCLPGGKIKD